MHAPNEINKFAILPGLTMHLRAFVALCLRASRLINNFGMLPWLTGRLADAAPVAAPSSFGLRRHSFGCNRSRAASTPHAAQAVISGWVISG